jgi:hypothetical protein
MYLDILFLVLILYVSITVSVEWLKGLVSIVLKRNGKVLSNRNIILQFVTKIGAMTIFVLYIVRQAGRVLEHFSQ